MVSVMVTITVESDRQRGRIQAHTSMHNFKGVLALHEAMKAAGLPPTYLVTYPVTQREEARPLLEFKAADECEIGACFQSWTTPPFDYIDAFAEGDRILPAQVLSEKLVYLTDAVSAWSGERPRSFRTCHARLTGQTLQMIERLGYRIDSSITPLVDRTPHRGCDWRRAPEVPYFPDRQEPTTRGGSSILEIPYSIGWPVEVPEALLRMQRRLPKALSQRLPQMIWLDPTRQTLEEMKALARVSVARGLPVLNVSMLSSELWRNQQAAQRTLEGFIAFAIEALGAEPKTMRRFCRGYLNQTLGV